MPGPADHPAAGAVVPGDGERLLADVRALILEVVGEDDLFGLEIDRDTSITEDVELESIEFVALAEKITERYDGRVDFIAWLGGLELDEIIALTIGDVVDLLVASGA